jgi:hypothetical protein
MDRSRPPRPYDEMLREFLAQGWRTIAAANGTREEKLKVLEDEWGWIGWGACHWPDQVQANEMLRLWFRADDLLRKMGRIK